MAHRLHSITINSQETTAKLLSISAVAAAAALSALALWDAVRNALTPPGTPPWDPARESELVVRGVALLHGVVYLLLAAVLTTFGRQIDGDSRALPWLRKILASCYLVLGLPSLWTGLFAPTLLAEAPEWALIAIFVAFLGTFVAAVPIGLLLLKHHRMHLSGWLLASPVILLPLTMLLDSISRWGHPAYLETVVNMGTALIGIAAIVEQRKDHAEPANNSPLPKGQNG